MRLQNRLSPLFAFLLSLTVAPKAGLSSTIPSDPEIRQAIGAIERANGYREIVEATARFEDVIRSPRTVALADEQLRNPALAANQRGLLLLERQLSLDCRLQGAAAAARLLSVRLIAGYALSADSPQQFAKALERFSPLAREMNASLVREALGAPADAWPKELLPLMQQFARDWPEHGALAAATRLADAARRAAPKSAGASGGPTVAGHWRSTTISFGSPRDEHLVLRAGGSAETWTVTATDRTPVTRGRWNVQGTALSLDWEDGRHRSQPFTFHEGQLVFPNIANRRKFWERIK